MTEQGINHNQVEVAGRIQSEFQFSHEIFGEGFYTVKLLVNRLSEATDELTSADIRTINGCNERLQRPAGKSMRAVPFLQQA